jgi:hypothetical protein
VGFQVEIPLVGGDSAKTLCWFRVLSLNDATGIGTAQCGLGVTEITAAHQSTKGIPQIPASVSDAKGNVYEVVSISAYAFGSQDVWTAGSYVTSAALPAIITSVGAWAFVHMSALTSLSVPAQVAAVGKEAFLNCPSLRSVTFSGASVLREISGRCFAYCTSLGMLCLPDSLDTIAAEAFTTAGL